MASNSTGRSPIDTMLARCRSPWQRRTKPRRLRSSSKGRRRRSIAARPWQASRCLQHSSDCRFPGRCCCHRSGQGWRQSTLRLRRGLPPHARPRWRRRWPRPSSRPAGRPWPDDPASGFRRSATCRLQVFDRSAGPVDLHGPIRLLRDRHDALIDLRRQRPVDPRSPPRRPPCACRASNSRGTETSRRA